MSEDDILKPFRESARKRRDWWLTRLAEGEELSKEFLDFARTDMRTATDIMVRRVISAKDSATVPELAELMVEHKIKRLPILRDGRVVGIVSRSDLVASIARAPALLV